MPLHRMHFTGRPQYLSAYKSLLTYFQSFTVYDKFQSQEQEMAWRLKTSGNTFAVSNGKHFPDVFDECAFSIFKTKHSYFGRQTMGMDAALSCATPITSPVGTANARRTQNFKSSINAARIILKCRRNPPPDSLPATRKLPSTDLIIVCVVVKCVLLSSYVYLLYLTCICCTMCVLLFLL